MISNRFGPEWLILGFNIGPQQKCRWQKDVVKNIGHYLYDLKLFQDFDDTNFHVGDAHDMFLNLHHDLKFVNIILRPLHTSSTSKQSQISILHRTVFGKTFVLVTTSRFRWPIWNIEKVDKMIILPDKSLQTVILNSPWRQH